MIHVYAGSDMSRDEDLMLLLSFFFLIFSFGPTLESLLLVVGFFFVVDW